MIKVVIMIAIGSLAADSISAIDATFLLIERVLNIEKTAAASVEDIMAQRRRDRINPHPDKNAKITDAMPAVSKTPTVASNIVDFIIGIRLFFLVPNPPAKSIYK